MAGREYKIADFNRIVISGDFDVEISRSTFYHITVSRNMLKHLRVYKEFDQLVLSHPWYLWLLDIISMVVRPKVSIAMPDIRELRASGGSRIWIGGFESPHTLSVEIGGGSSLVGHVEMGDIRLQVSGASRAEWTGKAKDLKTKTSGSSRVVGDVRASGDAEFEISGASRLELSGFARSAIVKAEGSSQIELGELQVESATVELKGASNATVNAVGRLDVDLVGASKLTYVGNPVMGNVNTAGASSVRRR